MAAFVTMVTETDGKPANGNEYEEGVKPVYVKKFRGAPSMFDPIPENDRQDDCCFCPCNPIYCVCCVCGSENKKPTSAA